MDILESFNLSCYFETLPYKLFYGFSDVSNLNTDPGYIFYWLNALGFFVLITLNGLTLNLSCEISLVLLSFSDYEGFRLDYVIV